jgi:phospholipid transport system substrate-binding protein
MTRIARATLVALLVALAFAARADEAASAREPVMRLHAALTALPGVEGGRPARLAALEPAIGTVFDLPAIARISLGRAWAGLDVAARETVTARLGALVTSTYVHRFAGARTPSFEILAVEGDPGGQRRVRTRLLRPDGEAVALDYLLVPGPDGPGIVDVVADGVSDLALRRAEYAALARRDGIDALLAHFDAIMAGHASAARDGDGG